MAKGVQKFWSPRSKKSRDTISKEYQELKETEYFKGDPKLAPDSNYLIMNDYKLPSKWQEILGAENCFTTLAIIFPDNYPILPPVGFYLKVSLPIRPKNRAAYAKAYEIADKTFIVNQSQDYKWYFNDNLKDWDEKSTLRNYLSSIYKFLSS